MSWEAGSTVVLALVLLAGFAWYERARPPARILALVATLAALAVVGRLAFAAVPNVKPTTDIVLFAGFALGAVPGFAVGAVTAIVSNVFLSQGPWTPWQMAGWGAVGIGGALLARLMRGREPSRILLAAVCGAAGLAFGAWMDLYQWTLAARQDLDTYLAVSASSLPYNVAHALGNVVFCLLIGPVFIRALRRYRRRLEVRWPARASAAAAALSLLLLLLPATAGAASPAQRAERWLVRAQNSDGGFGPAQGQRSSPLFSGWAGLALAAAGRNPRDVSRGNGRSLTAYLARRPPRDIGEVERTILVLEAAGLRSQSFRGRDLVAAVDRRRRADGSIAGFVSYTAFGVLALQASGEPPGGQTIRWLIEAQNDDGGFGVSPASTSDSDLTGAVLQALAAVGRERGGASRAAVDRLSMVQNADGGFGQMQGQSSNSQSTSYAVQGLVAAGGGGATLARALRYLRQRQRPNGSIAYSSSSTQTPVWVTAQALMALKRKPLPLAAVARAEPEPKPAPEPEEPSTSRSDAAPAAPPASPEPQAPAQEPAQEPKDNEPSPSAPDDGGGAPAPSAPADGGQGIEEDAPLSTDDGGLQLDPRTDAAGDPGTPGPPAFLVVLAALMAAGLLFLARRRVFSRELGARLLRRSPLR